MNVVERLNVDVPGANNVFWALSITHMDDLTPFLTVIL